MTTYQKTANGLSTDTADGYAAWARRGYRYDDRCEDCGSILDVAGACSAPFTFCPSQAMTTDDFLHIELGDGPRYAEAIRGARAMREREAERQGFDMNAMYYIHPTNQYEIDKGLPPYWITR